MFPKPLGNLGSHGKPEGQTLHASPLKTDTKSSYIAGSEKVLMSMCGMADLYLLA